MQATSVIIIFSLFAKLLLASTISYKEGTKATCEVTKNLTATCLHEEITLLHSAALAIHGNEVNPCDPLISEQVCQLCRLFNRSKVCLDILLDSCNYSEIHEFLWSHKVPYLGTVSSLCHQKDLLDEIYENLECYNGITVNLRKCFNAMERPLKRSCRDVNNGYTCAIMISEAYCAVLFKAKTHHKQLSSLYLRSLQPVIDLLNCTSDSQLFVAQVYPEYQYMWKKTSTAPVVTQLKVNASSPLEKEGSPMAAALVEKPYSGGVHLCVEVKLLLFLVYTVTINYLYGIL